MDAPELISGNKQNQSLAIQVNYGKLKNKETTKLIYDFLKLNASESSVNLHKMQQQDLRPQILKDLIPVSDIKSVVLYGLEFVIANSIP